MKPTMNQILGWYREFNERVFDDALPTVKITFTNTRRQLGQFYWGNGRGIGIKISTYWDCTEEQFRNVLLHEMCHLYCYNNGWIHEHHGNRWKKIADYATRVTGLQITRTTSTFGWEASEGNKENLKNVREKKKAPCIIVDMNYGDHHFIVKTSKSVLERSESTDRDWNIKCYGTGKVEGVYIVDDPLMQRMSTSRSIFRGFKYGTFDYEKTIVPILKRSYKVESVRDLVMGVYDCLGIVR